MLASASVPVAFPPVFFEVEAAGRRYDEMHVDGGVAANVFYSGGLFSFSAARAGVGRGVGREDIYIIHNGQLLPVPEQTTRSLRSIAMRVVRLSDQGRVRRRFVPHLCRRGARTGRFFLDHHSRRRGTGRRPIVRSCSDGPAIRSRVPQRARGTDMGRRAAWHADPIGTMTLRRNYGRKPLCSVQPALSNSSFARSLALPATSSTLCFAFSSLRCANSAAALSQ